MHDTEVLLGDLVNLASDKTATKDASKPYVGLEHILPSQNTIVRHGLAKDSTSTNSIFTTGDILFGKLRPRLRKCVQAPFDGYCSTDILVLRTKAGNDPRYAYYQVASEATFSEAIRTEEGTKMPRTRWEAIKNVHLPKVPLHQQQTIAELLSLTDKAIDFLNQIIHKLQITKVGLLKDLFTRGLDDNGELRDPKLHPEQFQDSPFGPIPKSWEMRKVCQISETYSGGTPSRAVSSFYGGSIPWVKSGEVNLPEIFETEETITDKALHASAVKWVEPMTPLIALYGATAGVVSWLSIRATTNQAILAIPPINRDETDARWFYWVLVYRAHAILAAVQGSGQPNLSKDIIDNILVPYPPSLTEQINIRLIMDSLLQRITFEFAILRKLKLLKNGLMQDLLTGRKRVLLERVSI